MKNLYTKNEFLNLRNEGEMINEGFIGKVFKSLFQSVVKLAKNIKGSGEINKVYNKYKNLSDQTFSKMKNIETAETTSKSVNNTPEKPTEKTTVKPTEKTTVTAQTESILIKEADEAPVQPKEDVKDQDEQKNLVNLAPEKIVKISQITQQRIDELKKQFNGEIDAIVAKLSKNPDYSPAKLKQYSEVMKNQFNAYVYDQWYNFYQKVGDKNKVLELTKLKKESDLNFKKSLDQLNTELGEKDKQYQVAKGKKFLYFSKNNNKDIEVEVIGKALGQDEKGQPDATNKDHANMWKVKSDGGEFWVSPGSFKKEIKVEKTIVKRNDIKVGNQYVYTKKDGQPGTATIVKGEDGNPIIDGDNVTVSGGKTTFPINISKLRPK